jgi:hypothetical protein
MAEDTSLPKRLRAAIDKAIAPFMPKDPKPEDVDLGSGIADQGKKSAKKLKSRTARELERMGE